MNSPSDGTTDASAPPTGTVLTLDPDPAAVRHARTFVTARCRAAGVEEGAQDAVVLLTSEVVTNAFLHGRSQAQLTVTTGGRTVRVEVTDDNSRHPTVAVRDDDALDGRGMALVSLLATRWGVRDEAVGKTVWFEIHR